METSTFEKFYKMRIEELEKQLDNRNFKIDSLDKELKFRSDELSRQIEKIQIVCEARDENKFRVVQLEKDLAELRKENDNLMSQLKEQKIVKNSRELSLEAVVASCADQIKKYEEKIEAYETKISQFETSTSISLSEKSFEKRSNAFNNEDGLRILQLESDIKLLSLENEDLKSKLGEEKERNNTKIKSYTDKLQRYEQTIKDCESKIIYLETEKKEIVHRCEEHLSEIKKLQTQLETHENCGKKTEEEKLTIAQLQKELENLKSLGKKEIQAETTEIKTMPVMGSVTREALELQECKNILKTFIEQDRNLQMKFEQEMKDKLQQIEDTISKEHDILNVKSPVKREEAQLPKAGKPKESQEKEDISAKSPKVQQKTAYAEAKDLQSQKMVKPKATSKKELQEKVEKDQSLHTPIKTQNKRLQKTAKTEVKDAESQKTVKLNVVSTSEKVLEEKVEKEDNSELTPLKPQNRLQKPEKTEVKKKKKKSKKIKEDENVYSPIDPKDAVSENIKTAVENISPIPKQGGRQLRTRRKV